MIILINSVISALHMLVMSSTYFTHANLMTEKDQRGKILLPFQCSSVTI